MTGYAPQSLWPLALAKGARVLAIVFIVLGAVVSVGFNSIDRNANFGPLKGLDQAIARLEVGVAHDSLSNATDTFKTSTQQCDAAPDPIQCLDQAASSLAGAFQTYGDALSRVNYPDSATTQAQEAETAARTAAAEVSDLSRSADVESYSATAQSAGFESSLQAVDSTYSALYSALGG